MLNRTLLVMVSLLSALGFVRAQTPAAPIDLDEGGVLSITGSLAYSDPSFTIGETEPLIVLEDQSGFIARDPAYVLPVSSQTLGQLTSDFYTSPFTYSLQLPIRPQAPLHQFDPNSAHPGVMVFAIAYWSNKFGDTYLETRDVSGQGWSSAYASTLVSSAAEDEGEYIGGTLLVYAPEADAPFPQEFGADARLFTGDEALVLLPAGYTAVSMDSAPFTFSRPQQATIDLLEGDFIVPDFTGMTQLASFDALVELLRREYAFTDVYDLDWDALSAEFRPRIIEAEQTGDDLAYYRALRDFNLSIPDGHVYLGDWFSPLFDEFLTATAGALGFNLARLDDGSAVIRELDPASEAAAAGLAVGMPIVSLDDVPLAEAMANVLDWTGPFSTPHEADIQRLSLVTRYPLDTVVSVGYLDAAGAEQRVTLTAYDDGGLLFSDPNLASGRNGNELPVETAWFADEGVYLIRIWSFDDDRRLTVLLLERALQKAYDLGAIGIIVDVRHNRGGDPFLAAALAGYFYAEQALLGQYASYDLATDAFQLEGAPYQVYPGNPLLYPVVPVVTMIGPNCRSACEVFALAMAQSDFPTLVGQYPTAGWGGNVEEFFPADGSFGQFTVGQFLDVATGGILIEGVGVQPTLTVPRTLDTLTADNPILDAAIAHLLGLAEGG